MSRRPTAPVVAVAGAAACSAAAVWTALRRRVPGGAERWQRTNHRGEQVSLLEGPAYAIAAAGVAALVPGVPPRLRGAAVVATLGAGVFGAIDDLCESGQSKGLRGHLGELAHGRLTTGGLKVLGIGATALTAALLAPTPTLPVIMHGISPAAPWDSVGNRQRRYSVHDHGEGGRAGSVLDVAVRGAVIAGTANLLNLFDLRPGRALKVVVLFAPAARATPAGRLVAVAAGVAAGLLPVDLGERGMLGDTGANAAGALLGTAAVAGLSRRGRFLVLLGLAALTLASERVSFTAVIARTPGLRELDALGRRPPEHSRRPPEHGRRPPEHGQRPPEHGQR